MFDSLKPLVLGAGLALGVAGTSQAAPVSFDLFAYFLDGPLVGSPLDPVRLTILYDDDWLTSGTADDGDGALTPFEGLEIAVFGTLGFETVDVDYPDFPEVVFEDYIPVSIDFLIDWFTFPELADFGIKKWRIGGDVRSNGTFPDLFSLDYDQATGTYSTGSTVAEIPLPAGLPLLAGGLGLLLLAARRRRNRG
jgi:hypothetical protein